MTNNGGAASGVVKKEMVVKVDPAAASKTAKSDSSFFTQPKKKVLPSFKKVPPAKRDDGAVSQPSNFDPFQEALNAMTGGSVMNATAASTNTPPAAEFVDMVIDGPKKPIDPLKRKKSVSFRPDEELEAIRWITRADYGEDENEV